MILVTGATGFLGGHLLWHLLQKNENVVAICRKSSNMNGLETILSFYSSEPKALLSRVEWRFADLNDLSTIENALEGIHIVYHCGAVVSLGGIDTAILETNVIGTRNLVNVVLKSGIELFCFVSSIAACGMNSDADFVDEMSPWKDKKNLSLYAKSKYYSEQEVWKGVQKGLKAVIVNPGVILGPFGTNSGSALLFNHVRKGLNFYTNGGSGYVDVRDVVKVMVQLVEKQLYGERYILVGENCSNKEVLYWIADAYAKSRPYIPISFGLLYVIALIAEILAKIFPFQPLVDRGTARSACNRSYFSNQKISKALDYRFIPIKQCVQDVCAFDLDVKK